MNNDTIKLLDKYDKNIKFLNISNKNIKGILDLKKFKKLNKLYCYSNEITKIINLPENLKCLDCSNNKIQILNNINFLKNINCKSNPIKILYYPFNIKPKKYPKTLVKLYFGSLYDQKIDNLINLKIIHLSFGFEFNQKVDT